MDCVVGRRIALWRCPPASSVVVWPNAMSNPTQPFDSRRRTANFGRQPEELHIPGSSGLNYSNSHRQSMSHEFHAMPDSGANHVPSINIHQPAGGPSVPGALQPGGVNRPSAMSMNTAPSVLPTLPQLSTQFPPPQQPQPSQQQPTTPRSSVSMSNSHTHSRSSPSGFDQPRYRQQGPDSSQYASPPGPGYPPRTPQGPKHSPLGLADIRPPQDLLGEVLMSPGGNQYNGGGDVQVPTNSNYIAPWPIYAVDWCKWPLSGSNGFGGKIALGSYLEDNHNYVRLPCFSFWMVCWANSFQIQIIDTHWTHPNPETSDAANGEIKLEYTKTAEATHSYPVTRILWEPPSSQKQTTDLLATSGDHLRLWSLPAAQTMQSNSITRPVSQSIQPAKLSPLALLSNSKSPEHTAPITSLDWNTISPSLIITSSIDTTCTIWDIPTLTAKTQLIAHDKEVFDVRFCANTVDVFVSCGADGSVRMFDLRSLEHSTIIYEPTEKIDKGTFLPFYWNSKKMLILYSDEPRERR